MEVKIEKRNFSLYLQGVCALFVKIREGVKWVQVLSRAPPRKHQGTQSKAPTLPNVYTVKAANHGLAALFFPFLPFPRLLFQLDARKSSKKSLKFFERMRRSSNATR